MSTQITAWCACGSTWTVNADPNHIAVEMHDTMRSLHTDAECRPVGQEEYRRIRARQRRREARHVASSPRGEEGQGT